MPGKVRRIVTGLNAAGKSCILVDEQLPVGELGPGEGVRVGIWATDRTPASNEGTDASVPPTALSRIIPAKGGSVFRVMDIAPDGVHPADPQAFVQRGAHVTPDRSARHGGFHMTDTIDYAICLEGEIWAVLDEEETLMKAGDIMIQRGTYHAWSNRSGKPARMAFILIDAEPVQHG